MKIHGITVCVNYAHFLTLSLRAWADGLDSLLVVTTHEDTVTQRLCKQHNVDYRATNIFYADGAKFNKGASIADAFEYLRLPDTDDNWLLMFDSDIEPESNWREQVDKFSPAIGNLYGAKRYKLNGEQEPDEHMAGYFLLSNLSDHRMQIKPIVDTHWYHAGNYDSTFMDRWPLERRIFLPIHLTHHGMTGINWCGVGNHQAMKHLHKTRQLLGKWDHETIG
jgi:hypothetical protein